MLAAMRLSLCLLIALVLSGCVTSGGEATFDPNRCDRNGDESQRRAC
jgi:hypothetical protein